MRIGIVMAGGTGERFWPISRATRPKQLLRFGASGRTLLEETLERLQPLICGDGLYIVTGQQLREPILQADLPVPPEQVLAEPCKRNTAGCIAYATAHVLGRLGADPAATTFAIVPADHFVTDAAAFRQSVEAAMLVAEQEEALVVVGVTPTRAETGYGYIEMGEESAPVPGMEEQRAWPVASFREKPCAEVAAELVASGRFCWNTGMFFWRASTFLAELERAAPEIAEIIHQMTAALRRDDAERAGKLFEKLPDISIDYALMERAQCVRVIGASFAWDDMGAWDAFYRVAQHDADANVIVGDPMLMECRNCLVYNEPGEESMSVAVVGMDGVIVVVAQDGVLVAPMAKAQAVREVVARLKERGARHV